MLNFNIRVVLPAVYVNIGDTQQSFYFNMGSHLAQCNLKLTCMSTGLMMVYMRHRNM
jgi:hypothetical protein